MPSLHPAVGSSCGICLELIASGECPSAATVDLLPTCDNTHAVGELCEADGECGTSPIANNCRDKDDIYRRCQSDLNQPPWMPPAPPHLPPIPLPPPSHPMPPLVPMPPCDHLDIMCTTGDACGVCLQPVDALLCPSKADVPALPDCSRVLPGELCEANGECQTAKALNNCHTKDDIYRRAACTPPPGGRASSSGANAIGAALAGGVAIGAGSAALVTVTLAWIGLHRCRDRGRPPRHGRGGAQRGPEAGANVTSVQVLGLGMRAARASGSCSGRSSTRADGKAEVFVAPTEL